MEISVIVTADSNDGIGYKNKIPWIIDSELEFFKKITTSGKVNAVIMGAKTWTGCLSREVLVGRINLVLSQSLFHTDEWPFDLYFLKSFQDALKICEDLKVTNLWIIGGEQIYAQALDFFSIKRIYLSRIQKHYRMCDTFFPLHHLKRFKLLQKDDFNLDVEIPEDARWRLEVYENQ